MDGGVVFEQIGIVVTPVLQPEHDVTAGDRSCSACDVKSKLRAQFGAQLFAQNRRSAAGISTAIRHNDSRYHEPNSNLNHLIVRFHLNTSDEGLTRSGHWALYATLTTELRKDITLE